MSSLTWDNAAWIYSVVVGVVLARYFMFTANLLQEPKAIKFYYPYPAFALTIILHLYHQWYSGKNHYTEIEGQTLQFAIKTFIDATICLAALIIVPQDKLLEDFFDMKSWFMKIKRAFFLIMALYFLTHATQMVVVFYFIQDTAAGQHFQIGFAIFLLVIMLLWVGAAFSKNNYYLSFHGTLTVLMSLRNLYQL